MATVAPTSPREAVSRALAEHARRRRAADPIEALTARQREIVLLAAAGLDNSAIARRLWLTRRTVEFHLTNAYRQLGVTGRMGLPAALHARDGTP